MMTTSQLVWWTVAMVAGGIIPYLLGRIVWRRRGNRRRKRQALDNTTHCPCGYDLTGVPIPRCPECGRAIGFDKTFEELGLNEMEIRRLVEVRRARQGSEHGQ